MTIRVAVGVALALTLAALSSPVAVADGAFFTLGFRGSDQTFVIRTAERKVVRQLRADLEKPRRGRRIVSGIARRKRPYNQPWHYTMGPHSIVLGEAFIEVCDASPDYVEQHRGQWRGERWCPWTSYVKREGR